MKCSAKFAVLFLITAFLGMAGVFVPSGALADDEVEPPEYYEPYVGLSTSHNTEVRFGEDGKVDFSSYDDRNGGIYMNIGNVSEDLTGVLNLRFNSAVTIDREGEDNYETLKAGNYPFDYSFELWSNNWGVHTPRYKGYSFDLVGAEAALEGTDFSFAFPKASPAISVTGKFPSNIRSTKEQFDSKCVPYLDLVTEDKDGEKILTGVKWRFVDPDDTDTALTAGGTGITYVYALSIYPLSGDSSSITLPIHTYFADTDTEESVEASSEEPSEEPLEEYPDNNFINKSLGDPLSGDVSLDNYSIPLTNVNQIQLIFRYGDVSDAEAVEHLSIWYSWYFMVNDDDDEEGEGKDEASYNVPDAAAVDYATKATNSNLSAIKPTSIVPVKPGDVSTTLTKLLVENGSVSERTSSAITMEQKLDQEGGAILLTELELPIRSRTFDDLPLPEPKIANGLPENYSVYKSFKNAGTIDLMRKFGTKLFKYDEDAKTVRMTAALVVIDGPYKDDKGNEEPGVEPVFKGDYPYGVKLSDDGDYLYVYDGVKDGYASDPLWIGADGDAGGSGGCDAGLGAGAILALAGFVLLGIKKRG
jgi:hypothetical protein